MTTHEHEQPQDNPEQSTPEPTLADEALAALEQFENPRGLKPHLRRLGHAARIAKGTGSVLRLNSTMWQGGESYDSYAPQRYDVDRYQVHIDEMIEGKLTVEGKMPDELYTAAIEAKSFLDQMEVQQKTQGKNHIRRENENRKDGAFLAATSVLNAVTGHPAFIKNPDAAADIIAMGVGVDYTEYDEEFSRMVGEPVYKLDERCDTRTMGDYLNAVLKHEALWGKDKKRTTLWGIAKTLGVMSNEHDEESFEARMTMLTFAAERGTPDGEAIDDLIYTFKSHSDKARLETIVSDKDKSDSEKLIAKEILRDKSNDPVRYR